MKMHFVDWILLGSALWLSFLSSIILFSYSSDIGIAHVFSLGLGILVFFLMYFFPKQLFQNNVFIVGILGTVLLIVTLVFGDTRGGATRWLNVGGFGFQPSEVVKLLFIFLVAYVYSTTRMRFYLYGVVFTLLYFCLIALQPDLDTALTFVVVLVSVLFYRFPFKRVFLPGLLVCFCVILISTPIIWQHFLKDYQRVRILTFFESTRDPLGAGYHANQALITVGRGGFWGTGIGRGTQFRNNFLPEHTTDFAFASISEELGFIGSSSILFALGAILWRLLWFADRTHDLFVRLVCVAVFSLLCVHIVMNIGMNIGLMPVMGITLPFISYGGSSLIVFYALFGFVSAEYVAWRRYS